MTLDTLKIIILITNKQTSFFFFITINKKKDIQYIKKLRTKQANFIKEIYIYKLDDVYLFIFIFNY